MRRPEVPGGAFIVLDIYKSSVSAVSATAQIHQQPPHARDSFAMPERYHFCMASTEYPACSAALSCVYPRLPHRSTASASFHVRFARRMAKSTSSTSGARSRQMMLDSFICSSISATVCHTDRISRISEGKARPSARS